MNWYRFVAVSDHWAARALRKAHKRIRYFSIPAPRAIFLPILTAVLLIRSIYFFFLRVFICEPLFKAYCTRYGSNVRTGTYLHWIQGKGEIVLGDNIIIDGKCSIQFAAQFSDHPTLTVGSNTGISHGCRFVIGKAITIGSFCRIAGETQFFDSSGHVVDPKARLNDAPPPPDSVRPIVIGDHVWVGMKAIIFPGVTIGEGAVVSAGSVVMNDVEPYTVVAGNPAGMIGIIHGYKPRVETAPGTSE